MCYKMGRDQTLFIEHFYPYMIQLVTDSVPNVRITLASVLKEIYNSNNIF